MNTQEKISGAQLFAALFVCRVVGLFTFTAPQEASFSAGDRVAFLLPFLLLCLLCAIPSLLTARHKDGALGLAAEVSPGLAKAAAVLFCAAFVCAAALGTLRFERFTGDVMFPAGNTLLPTALLLAAAGAAAIHGTQALGRASVILLGLLTASLAFILLSTARRFSWVNLTPPLESGAGPALQNALYSLCRTPELAALALAPMFTKGSVPKTGLRWLTVFSLAAAVIFCCIGGVTGAYGEKQAYPLYALTVVAESGVFQRMDALLTGLWTLAALLRAAFFLRLAANALERGFGKKLPVPALWAGAGITFGLFLAFSSLAAATDGKAAVAASGAVAALSAIALPTVLLLARRIGGRKKNTQ